MYGLIDWWEYRAPEWLKSGVVLAVAGAFVYGWFLLARTPAPDASCLREKACADSRAQAASRTSERPVTRGVSRTFFRGSVCAASCEAWKAGYAWAEHVGLTNPDGCDQVPAMQRDGCAAYYQDLEADQYEPLER